MNKEREIINLLQFDDIWEIIYGDYDDENGVIIFEHIDSTIEDCDEWGRVDYTVIFKRVSDNKFFSFQYKYNPHDSNEFPDEAEEVFPKQVMTTIYE